MICGGIILCGGQSRRMGRPKAWLRFGGELLLPRIVRILSQVVAPVVVVAAPDQDLPPLPPSVPIVRDDETERGPMMGLAMGLSALVGRVDAAYLSACDTPFLRPAFIQYMVDALGSESIAVPRIDEFFHPLAAVYRVNVLATVQELLCANELRMSALFERLPTRFVTGRELVKLDPTLQSLRNINTPEEYEDALREVEGRNNV